MIRIKLGLFEGIACCTILPTIGLVFTAFLSIISIFEPQTNDVYMGLLISLVASVTLLALSLPVCKIIHQKSKNELTVFNDGKSFQVNGKTYYITDVKSCKYYTCKWYAIPFLVLYKQGNGGAFDIKLASGKTIHLKILYKDFLKLKQYFPNIIEI